MTRYLYALIPLLVLMAAISLACIIGYFIYLGVGDALPFRKIISKSTQVFLILSIFPFMAYLKISKAELGFAPRPVFFRQLLQGFGLGLATLLPVFLLLYVLGVHVSDPSQPWTLTWLLGKLLTALLAALAISWIEEPLFRGILLTGLGRKLPVIAAVFFSAFYYAALHFLDTRNKAPIPDINLFSGFQLLDDAFANLLNPSILSAFVALFMVGLFLATLRAEIKNGLGLCIGCHTAWVWQIKMSKTLFNTNPHSDYLYLISSYDGVIGPLVSAWLMVAIAGFFIFRQIESK